MKILVAEDDPAIMESLKSILEREGFTMIGAGDGASALSLWHEEKPAIVCLDIMMPVMDGYQVCREIRKSDAYVPILFLSAKSDETDVVVGLELGANDFIRKPFGKHEFLARIRTALRQYKLSARREKQSVTEACFSLGDLQVFPDELRAERDGLSIDLSPRESQILKFFSDHPGKVISRDALLDACWGIDYFPESRTLDQQISRLRKKIEPCPATPIMIETVRGVGYRFPSA